MRATKPPPDENRPQIEASNVQGTLTLILRGVWDTHSISSLDDEVRRLENHPAKQLIIDASALIRLDTGGAWVIERLAHGFIRRSIAVEFVGIKPGWQALLQVVGASALHKQQAGNQAQRAGLGTIVVKFLDWLGQRVMNLAQDFLMAMHILGAIIVGAGGKSGAHRSGINFASIITQIDRMGVGAMPIILLMSFIVGAIIAQQGAFQLRYFGGELFVVDLVGILVFRELGVLMTAIMIAGRSGSAITAEIGSMKMREEVDALTVMGLNPVAVLVMPRLIALLLVLPFLTILADLAALIGAGLVTLSYSGIPLDAFIVRLKDAVWVSTYLAGLIKAPFMALIIGIIAAVEGMKVKGSAESLGRRVTSSVVKSIFIVIVIDGLFAIFYASINF